MRTAKTLIRLGRCPSLSESSLDAQSFCWFCHVAAQLKRKDRYKRKESEKWLLLSNGAVIKNGLDDGQVMDIFPNIKNILL